MKNKNSLSFVFALCAVLFLTVFASSAQFYFEPMKGTDNTDTSFGIVDAYLANVTTSDNRYYTTDGNWNGGYDSEYVDFQFNPPILGSSSINAAKFVFEWRNSTAFNLSEVRFLISNANTGLNSGYIYLNSTSTTFDGTDFITEIDLAPYFAFNTPSSLVNFNNIVLRFEAIGSPIGTTRHDFASLVLDSPNNITAFPTCSVDFLQGIGANSGSNFNLTANPFINQTGTFRVHGYSDAGSSACSIKSEGYNRTSPDMTIFSFNPSSETSPLLNFGWADTNPSYDRGYVQGNHTVCCQVISQATCNTGNCGQLFVNTSCTSFCIDTQAPTVTSVVDNTTDCSASGRYSNSQTANWSWSAFDNGCSGLKQYNVTVYANGSVLTSFITNSTSYSTSLVDGTVYSLSVFAIDNALNVGSAASSQNFTTDFTAPVVTITSPVNGTWYNNASLILLNETDVDANLMNCSVSTNQSYSSALTCNTEVYFDADDYCANEGSCLITKTAQDSACNMGTDNAFINMDRLPPQTNKTVGTPKVNASWYADLSSWVAQLVDGFFVTADTPITLNAADTGVGMGTTYYNITYPNGTVVGPTAYSGAFNLPNIDGKYTITYWSVDALGNIESSKYEIDKLDNIAPTTVKKIVNNYTNATGSLFVNSCMDINFSCSDSESGCDYLYYNLTNASGLQDAGSFIVNGSTNNVTYCLPITLADGMYNLSYQSVDRLNNVEAVQSEIDFLDNTPPFIFIWNPSLLETSRNDCSMDIEVEVFEAGSGLKQPVYAQLTNGSGVVKTVNLSSLTNQIGVLYGGKWFSGFMDTTGLSAGNYTLYVYAQDNLNNTGVAARNITLNEGIQVQYISPSSCAVNPTTGGNCSFTFNACIRDSDSIRMWMEKLNGNQVSPFLVNATIANGSLNGQVGLMHDGNFTTTAGLLNLTTGCENINGMVKFNLTMNINQSVAQLLGGRYAINYTVVSYDDHACVI